MTVTHELPSYLIQRMGIFASNNETGWTFTYLVNVIMWRFIVVCYHRPTCVETDREYVDSVCVIVTGTGNVLATSVLL